MTDDPDRDPGASGQPPPLDGAPDPTESVPGPGEAAPVGWTGQDIGSPSALPPPRLEAPARGAATHDPAVAWQAPVDRSRPVPGAPGLVFADTSSRFVAYLIDVFLIGLVALALSALFGFGRATLLRDGISATFDTSVSSAVFSVPYVLVGLLYFVFCWTGGRRATIGQRLFDIQVGNAFDGHGLSVDQAIRRWLGYGTFLALLAIVPGLDRVASGLELVWVFALLVTTATSATKQGFHDRLANSAVVRPKGHGSSGFAIGCLVVIVVLAIFALVALIGLLLIGDEIREFLREVGRSV